MGRNYLVIAQHAPIPMKIRIQIQEANLTHPVYELTLHKSYFQKGFFNLGVSVDRYIQSNDGPMKIYLGDSGKKLDGRSDRRANQNGTPRIHVGMELSEWFVGGFEEMDTIDVIILSLHELKLRKKIS